MEEFSAASGISRPTLSRFFNDPRSVRPTSRARIEAAMSRFSYRPNLFAVNVNRRNPKILAILVPSLLDPFYAGLVQRIEKLALQAGYWTITLNAQGDEAGEAEAVTTVLSLNVAGVIAIPLGFGSRKGIYREVVDAMPFVFLDARVEDAAFVGTDNVQSMGLMVDYLLRSGSAPIYFDMPAVNQNATERRSAYESAMMDSGEVARVINVQEQAWDFERIAFDEATRLFRAGTVADVTILCANDRIAFGVMAAASQAGLTIARKGGLRIAGHDDHPLSRYACPPLTTVAQDGERLADVSLNILLAAVNNGANGRLRAFEQRLEGKLVMRASA